MARKLTLRTILFRVIIFHPVLVIQEIVEHSLQGCTIPINYNSNEPNQHLVCRKIEDTFECHKFDIKPLLMNCRMPR